jgi:predicted enzyme related to lactoylglutathione lyase
MEAEPSSSGDARANSLSHGTVCYLQLPAIDVLTSAEFYEKVFGWQIERPYPSFESPGLIGQWVDDRAPTADAGVLLWINVDDINATCNLISSTGGVVLTEPAPDGPRWLATVRDPAGNTIGIAQHRTS